jgi:hypothetical protein
VAWQEPLIGRGATITRPPPGVALRTGAVMAVDCESRCRWAGPRRQTAPASASRGGRVPSRNSNCVVSRSLPGGVRFGRTTNEPPSWETVQRPNRMLFCKRSGGNNRESSVFFHMCYQIPRRGKASSKIFLISACNSLGDQAFQSHEEFLITINLVNIHWGVTRRSERRATAPQVARRSPSSAQRGITIRTHRGFRHRFACTGRARSWDRC